MRIELEYDMDELTKRKYVFWFDESRSTLWVDGYHLMQRESKRHKYKTIEFYDRLRDRESTIRKEDVPLDDKIKQDAINKLIENVKVDYWKGR